jgi:ligand-binding sensor protein
MAKTVENLKAEGAYREAGALAAQQDKPCYYGCHFGMRSSRALAMHEFQQGYYDEKAAYAARQGANNG